MSDALRRALARHPVVLLVGPGGIGKSTVARAVMPEATNVSLLQDEEARRIATTDPSGFLSRLGTPAVIDDVHLAPQVLDELQLLAGRSHSPGQVLVVASAAGMSAAARRSSNWTLPRVSMGSLTQAELQGRVGRVIPSAFSGDPASWPFEPLSVSDYVQRCQVGGVAQLVGIPDVAARTAAYRSRIESKLEGIEPVGAARLQATLSLIGSSPNAKVSLAADAERLRVSPAQLGADLGLLEELGLVRQLLPWTRFRRHGDTLRVYLTDPGFLGALPTSRPDAERFTELALRTLIVHELSVQNAWARHPVDLSFWRSKPSTFDVDVLLENREGSVVPVSISPSDIVTPADFAPIDAFRRRHPRAYRRGLLLHPGTRLVSFGDQRWAVPISVLWTLAEREAPLDVSSLDAELEEAASTMKVMVSRPRTLDPEVGERRAQLTSVLNRTLTPRLERISLVLASLGLGAKEVPVCADPPGPDDGPTPAWLHGLRLTLLRKVTSPRLTVLGGLTIDAGDLGPPQMGSPRWVAFVSCVFDGTGSLRWHAGHALLDPPTDPPSEARLVGLAGPVLCGVGEVDEALIDQLTAALAATLPDALAALASSA